MRSVYIVRRVAITGLAFLAFGCASHRAAVTCPKPAKVVGTNSSQGGWVLVREDRSSEDTAARIAAAYHVRTQSLTYVHGFNTYPVPDDPKFLCDKAVVEVHYAAPQRLPGR
jgi:hypothetical protein